MAKKSTKNIVKINWEESEGTKFLRKPGEYIVIATKAEIDEDDEGRQFITWTFEVVDGKEKGSSITTKTYITPKALWKLRELLECMKVEVTNSVQDIDLDEIVENGEKFVIEVEEGNERPDGNGYYMQVSDYMSYEDYREVENGEKDEQTEEEEPVSKSPKKNKKIDEEGSKSKKSSKEEVEEDEEDLLDKMEEEIDELGLDIDLDDYDTFEEKQEAFEKAKKKIKKSSKEEVEEDEEETQTYTMDEINELGTKQLKVIAEEIGLELDEDASTRSKRRSVIQALKKQGLLEE